jgi:hypothetical protein
MPIEYVIIFFILGKDNITVPIKELASKFNVLKNWLKVLYSVDL